MCKTLDWDLRLNNSLNTQGLLVRVSPPGKPLTDGIQQRTGNHWLSKVCGDQMAFEVAL